MALFHGVNLDELLKIKGTRGYGVSAAVARGNDIETYCAGSGRFGWNFPVTKDMLFQAGSVSKSMFSLTLLRYVDKGIIDPDADISGVVSDFVDFPLTFPALLSHTAGFNVSGFPGYRAKHKPLALEDVLSGRGNTKKIEQTIPYGKQYSYSGGGITLAELAFTRITGTSLRTAFEQEVAVPLGLTRSGFFQPLEEDMVSNAAFGGWLGILEDRRHGYHYYPEHAAAGFWSTPTELAKIGIALSRSVREDGLLRQKTAKRMITPILEQSGLCLFTRSPQRAGHSGWNAGFLTEWIFSPEEDLCVAVMTNRGMPSDTKRLSDAADMLFEQVYHRA